MGVSKQNLRLANVAMYESLRRVVNEVQLDPDLFGQVVQALALGRKVRRQYDPVFKREDS